MRRPDLRIRVQLTVSVCLFTLICLVSLAVSIYVLSRSTILDLQGGNLDLNCRMLREECRQEMEDVYDSFYRLTFSTPVRDIYSADSNEDIMLSSAALLHDSFGPNRILVMRLYNPNGTLLMDIDSANAEGVPFTTELFPLEEAANSANSTEAMNNTVTSIVENEGFLVGPLELNQTVAGTKYMMSLTLPVTDTAGYIDSSAVYQKDDQTTGYITFIFSALRLQTLLSTVFISSSDSLVGSTALCSANANLTTFTQLIPLNDPTVLNYYNTTLNSNLQWSNYKTHSLFQYEGDFEIPPEMAAKIAKNELPSAGIDKGPEKSTISIAQFAMLENNFYVVMLQSHKGVYDMPHQLRNNIVISSCSIATAMVIFTFLFVSFGARQILRLKMAATYQYPTNKRWWIIPIPWWLTPAKSQKHIQSSDSTDYDYLVPEKVPLRKHVRDELDDITERFNLMSGELKRQYAKLEDRVQLRKAEIEQAREAADVANAAKSHFLARVTHELRTPLNGIIGTATLCLEEDNIDEVHKSLLTIFKCGELLLHLMTDLLSFSQNEVENLELELRDFKMPEITSQLSAIFTEQCSTKKINLRVESSPEFDGYVFSGDTNRILQVIFNLMSNGIKFTPQGGEVYFKADLGDKNPFDDIVNLVFTVKDNGPGIAPEMQAKVFEAFVQGDISTQIKKAGVGLGLSICRQLAERMGGTITLSSELGEGCTFVFVVPLQFRVTTPGITGVSSESMDLPGSVVFSKHHSNCNLHSSTGSSTGTRPSSPTTPPINSNKEFGSSNSTPDLCSEGTPESTKSTHHMFLSRTSRTISTASLKAKEFRRKFTQDSSSRHKESKEKKAKEKEKEKDKEKEKEKTKQKGKDKTQDQETDSNLCAKPIVEEESKPLVSNRVNINSDDKKRYQSEEIRRAIDIQYKVDDANKPISLLNTTENEDWEENSQFGTRSGSNGSYQGINSNTTSFQNGSASRSNDSNLNNGSSPSVASSARLSPRKPRPRKHAKVSDDKTTGIGPLNSPVEGITENIFEDSFGQGLSKNHEPTSPKSDSLDADHTEEDSIIDHPSKNNRDSFCSANNLSVIQSIPPSRENVVKKSELNVLVVDDNLVNQEVMMRMLNLEGVKSIKVASDGVEAVEAVKEATSSNMQFNIIFMDVQMPRMDGRQASKIIREELHLGMPIVAVSAFANEKNAKECIDAGMNLFLSKPLVRPHLQEILRRLAQ